MALLSLETSTECCSVALESQGRVYENCTNGQHIHSQVLLPSICDVLSQANRSFCDIEGIVVGNGPGGFTSLRIGLAVAQGLAVSHQVPIYPVSSLLNVASACPSAKRALVIMDARMGEVYVQSFSYNGTQGWSPESEPIVVDPRHWRDNFDALSGEMTVLGTGVSVYKDLLARHLPSNVQWESDIYPSAARALGLKQQAVSAWSLKANYVRNQVAHG